jgi:hypothetical protein
VRSIPTIAYVNDGIPMLTKVSNVTVHAFDVQAEHDYVNDGIPMLTKVSNVTVHAFDVQAEHDALIIISYCITNHLGSRL